MAGFSPYRENTKGGEGITREMGEGGGGGKRWDMSNWYCTVGAFNLYFFLNFNRNQTENDRYLQINNFLLFANF
jgi:hypothetical protein